MPERKVLYVINAFETDAPTLIIISLARAMHENGTIVFVVAWSRGGPVQVDLTNAGIANVVLNKQLIAGGVAISQIVRSFKPDIIHTSLVRPAIGTAIARIVMGSSKPVWIAMDHGIHEWHEKSIIHARAMDMFMPGILETADIVTTVSKKAASQLISKGLNPHKIKVLSNGVDIRRFYPGSKAAKNALLVSRFPNIEAGKVWPLIGAAGNLRTIKGYADLLNALPQVVDHFPQAICLIWGTGPELEHLESLAADLGISDFVSFCGRSANLDKQLPFLDLFIQPSHVESFGLAAAEAMACGVPVIASKAGGLPELTDNGRVAGQFRAGFPNELAAAILDALGDKRKLNRWGTTGRLQILDKFTQTKMITETCRLYAELTGKAGFVQ